MKKNLILFLIWLVGAVVAYPIDKYNWKLLRHNKWSALYSMQRWDKEDRAWCIARSCLSWGDVLISSASIGLCNIDWTEKASW